MATGQCLPRRQTVICLPIYILPSCSILRLLVQLLAIAKATKNRPLVALILRIKELPKCLYQKEAVFALTSRYL